MPRGGGLQIHGRPLHRASFVAQRNKGIDAGGAQSGNETGNECDGDEESNDAGDVGG
jgi:hypothetical protein